MAEYYAETRCLIIRKGTNVNGTYGDEKQWQHPEEVKKVWREAFANVSVGKVYVMHKNLEPITNDGILTVESKSSSFCVPCFQGEDVLIVMMLVLTTLKRSTEVKEIIQISAEDLLKTKKIWPN